MFLEPNSHINLKLGYLVTWDIAKNLIIIYEKSDSVFSVPKNNAKTLIVEMMVFIFSETGITRCVCGGGVKSLQIAGVCKLTYISIGVTR